MSEHSVAIVSFEGALKREVKRVREELKKLESLSGFKLTIEAQGRVNDGQVKLTYSVGEEYGVNAVSGDSLQAVLDEFLRRKGWTAVHAPKAIGYEKVPSDDTDMPF